MKALFGGMPDAARFIVAFLLVLGLSGAGAFLWRRFGVGSLRPRGRHPRLAVIDSAAIDGRRRLVLIRRDNTEHLLMIGGPSDLVIEPNIVRAAPIPGVCEPRPGASADLPTRQPAPPDPQGWPQPFGPEIAAPALTPSVMPPEPPFHTAVAPEPRRAPVQPPSPPPAYEPVFQTHAPVFRSTVMMESKRAQTVPPRPSHTDEKNLAEMAQRLEAALRNS
jgi:flagellar protein FliO/FliZ